MTRTVPDVQKLADQILRESAHRARYTVAIAGPPAGGKTTLTTALANALSAHKPVAVVAMDGFHFDNAILRQRDRLHRKGAPDTFDVNGFRSVLSQLAQQTEDLVVPVFDRELDLSRACASIVSPADQLVLVEGNYLLVQTPPWNIPQEYFDLSVFLSPSIEVLEERLVERWLAHDHSPADAVKRANANDLPNARYVLENSRTADIVL